MVALNGNGAFQRFYASEFRFMLRHARFHGGKLLNTFKACDRSWIIGRKVAEKLHPVSSNPPGDIGIGDSNAERAPKLANHVVEPCSLPDVFAVQPRNSEHGNGNENKPKAESA